MDQQPTNTNIPTGPGNMFTSSPFLSPLPPAPEPEPEPPRGKLSAALHLLHAHMRLTTAAGVVVIAAAGAGFVLTHHTHPAPAVTGNSTQTTATTNQPTTSTTAPSSTPGQPTAGQTNSTNPGATTQTPAPTTKTTSGGGTQTTNNSGGSGTANSGGGGTSGGTTGSSWWASSTTGSGSLIPTNQLNNGGCGYQTDTWSGDAGSVGYTATPLSNSNGNPASFSVRLNANSNNQEVVGYPSVQCILYEAMPSNLNSSFHITPPASSNGLVYEYAYDIWLTTASKAASFDWSSDLELMIWTYDNGQEPIGYWDTPGHTPTATMSDGSKIYTGGDSSTGTVSVMLPSNMTSGNVNIASLVTQLKTLGYVNSGYNGILDVEYGIEAPYGGNQTFAVNSLSLMN